MTTYIPKQWAIQPYSVSNGTEARAIHPEWIDVSQKYLISGCGWHVPATIVDGTSMVPVIIPPWVEFIAFGLRAVLTDPAGTVDVTLEDSTTTKISLTDISLDNTDLTVTTSPGTLTAWQSIPWYGAGSIGNATPPATGKGSLQIQPVNAWTDAVVKFSWVDCEVHDLFWRFFASSTPLSS